MKTTIPSKGVGLRTQPRPRMPYTTGHILIYAGCLLIILVIGWLSLKAFRMYGSYRAMTEQLTVLETDPAQLELSKVQKSARIILTELDNLTTEAQPLLSVAPALGWLPGYGADLQALPLLVAVGRDLSQAGLLVEEALTPLFAPGDATGNSLPTIVADLAGRAEEIKTIRLRLQAYQTTLATLETASLSPRLASRVGQLQEYLPTIIAGLQVAEALPALLGADSPSTYLILTQNADEIRPSGGYINAAGHIIIDRGQIVDLVMEDSYAVDHLSPDYPYPPLPLYQYMAADYWVLRDAGWSPDFPTTARTTLALYELGQGLSADGVIALDQHALPYLLQAFKPLQVDGDQVTSENIVSLMRQHWAPAPDQGFDDAWWLQRKSFMLDLAQTMRQTVEQDFGAINLSLLVQGLQQALAERHILLYVNDPMTAELLAGAGWDGSLPPTQGDYLMLVEANLGFNKASAIIERQMQHQVMLAADGSAEAQTSLFYHHPAPDQDQGCRPEPRYDPVYEQNMARCYWNYGRLLVPVAADLIRGPSQVVGGQYLLRGEPTTGEIDTVLLSAEKKSWGQLFLLPTGENLSLDYVYKLPPNTARPVGDSWQYSLYLQKQAGTLTLPTEVIIKLPAAAQFLSSQPTPLAAEKGKIIYQLDLRTDQIIDLIYRLGSSVEGE